MRVTLLLKQDSRVFRPCAAVVRLPGCAFTTMPAMATFWTTAELILLGKSKRDIALAVERGVLKPVRRGHFASAGAPIDILRAARVGGVATATSATRAMGVWTPPDTASSGAAFFRRGPDRLHVAVARNAARLRDPDHASSGLFDREDVVLHWVHPSELVGTARTRIAPVLLTLQHVFATQPPERALAVLDSAIRLRHIRPSDLATLIDRLPSRLAPVVRAADPRADSGIETIVRFLLRSRGLRVEVLATIGRVGEVDLLVEGRLIIELDGREFHDTAEAFERDRWRDLNAAISRYRTLRFTWFQVLYQWDQVEAAIFAALGATA